MFSLLLTLVGCHRSPTPDQEERFFVGNLLDGMKQALTLHAELRGRRVDQLTDDEQAVLRHSLGDLRSRRTGLELSVAKLAPRDAAELEAFLDRWSRERLEEGLMASPSAANGLDAEVGRLVRRFPVNTYRSPFARFPKVK